eukprot:Nk52_evm8s257 gene=Nk52_evmTU8s257
MKLFQALLLLSVVPIPCVVCNVVPSKITVEHRVPPNNSNTEQNASAKYESSLDNDGIYPSSISHSPEPTVGPNPGYTLYSPLDDIVGCFAAFGRVQRKVVLGVNQVQANSSTVMGDVESSFWETVSMIEVNIGDTVKTRNGESAIVRYRRRDVNLMAKFIEVTHAKGKLTLTPNHRIFILRNRSEMEVPAESLIATGRVFIKEGDHMYAASIRGISRTNHMGVYAPLTLDGTIIVDNTVVSCYAESDKWYLRPLLWFYHTVNYPYLLLRHYIGKDSVSTIDGMSERFIPRMSPHIVNLK